jgi:hypothetical protein
MAGTKCAVCGNDIENGRGHTLNCSTKEAREARDDREYSQLSSRGAPEASSRGLVACPECEKQISSQSEYCVHCGFKPQMSRADHALASIARNVSNIWTVVLLNLIATAIVVLAIVAESAGRR